MLKTFEEANKYLENFLPSSKEAYKTTRALRLERITYLLELLGNPHKKLKFIHIGGTSGKGSVAYFLSQLLADQGYKTGLHTNPHLQVIPERMQISGQPISKERFVDYINKFKPLVKRVGKDLRLGEPSYFEILVAVSLDYFTKEKVDIAVVEVGLGGTLDATNVIKPICSIITNVSLDHTEILGKTVQKIAKDKAGIIKEGVPVITGAKQPSVRKIISKKAASCGSKVYFLGEDFSYRIRSSDLAGNGFDFNWGREKYSNLRLAARGAFQVENASLALASLHLLKRERFYFDETKLYKSLKSAKVPGRFEIVQKEPLVILDAAHNPTKIKTFIRSLSTNFPNRKFIFLIAFKEGKDIRAMLKVLIPHSKVFVISEFFKVTDFGRRLATPAVNIRELLKTLSPSQAVLVEKDSEKALQKAKKLSGKNEIVVVTGSLYLVGETRELFFPSNN